MEQKTLEGKLLTFLIEDKSYGIDLNNVIEIISMLFITPIPSVPHYIKGIINLRGKIVPVMDIRLKLGLQELAYDEFTCIIVVTVNDMQIGLIVDRVSEVVNVHAANQFAVPTTEQTNQYLQSIAEVNGTIILRIEFDQFFHDDLYLT